MAAVTVPGGPGDSHSHPPDDPVLVEVLRGEGLLDSVSDLDPEALAAEH